MCVDNLLDQSNETLKIKAFYNTLNSIDDSFNNESWLDELYETAYGPEDDMNDDWMDDLDDAA